MYDSQAAPALASVQKTHARPLSGRGSRRDTRAVQPSLGSSIDALHGEGPTDVVVLHSRWWCRAQVLRHELVDRIRIAAVACVVRLNGNLEVLQIRFAGSDIGRRLVVVG